MRLTLARPTLKRCSNLFQTNLWQGSRLIAETDNDKHWQTYLYEPDSYRPLALVHGNAQQDNIKLYWYQNDHLGTPIALTSNMGDTLYECQYNAYGQIINEIYHQDDIDSLPDNPLRFQGQYYDEETGLHYNLNRYYDPFTGRYITQDPLGIQGGLNSYQYSGSDPINWIDPLGLIKVENNGFEGVAGKGADSAPQADAAKYSGQERQYWTKDPIEFNGNKVYQRDDVFDPNVVSSWKVKGKTVTGTNIDRMADGLAPIGKDGRSVNLHHMIQSQNGPIAEVTQQFHKENHSIIHINPNTIPSGINRSKFESWKKQYWKNRAASYEK
jgi:RHS repeat-associated protein